MFEINAFEEATRQAIRSAGDDDVRVIELIDTLPLAPKLTRLGMQLGESEDALRAERRALFSHAICARDDQTPSVSQARTMRRLASDLRVVTRQSNLAEMIYQIVEWRMIGERVERIESMGRA